jgi:hypothetical protein
MPKNETGEFELVLGNKQLLSGFAVVVILFGVFFAMGYVVGRSSAPAGRGTTADTQTPATTATANQPDPARAQTTPPPSPAPVAGSEPAAAPPAQQPAPVADSTPAPATQAQRPPEPPKPAEKPAEAAAPAVQASDSLQSGLYLQVIATIRSDAEVISKSLQDRKFATVITPSVKEGRFRVLVGPYKDATALGGAKTELENLGFHPFRFAPDR